MKKSLLLASGLAAASASFAQVSLTNSLAQIEGSNTGILNITQDLDLGSLSGNVFILETTTIVNPGVTLTIPAGSIIRSQPATGFSFVQDTDSSGNLQYYETDAAGARVEDADGDDVVTTSAATNGTDNDPKGSQVASNIPGTLLVSRGGAIDAVGTATSPIIFTTAANTDRDRYASGDTFLDADPVGSPLTPLSVITGDDPDTTAVETSYTEANVGLWGAVTLLGYAPTNRGTSDTGVAGEAYIEGFGMTTEQVTYGGSLPNDSSGKIKYVSIRHSGKTIVEGDEQQGLTLGGVGAGTLIENIDIYCSADDGIEIFGGTASLRNVMISYVNDDGFDLDQGWTGNAQFLFILASNITDPTGLVTFDECGEWDGQDGVDEETSDITTAIATLDTALASGTAAEQTAALAALNALTESDDLTATGQPFMAPTIYNMTVFADGASGSLEIDAAFGGAIYNSILTGLSASSFDIEDETSANPISNGFPSASPAARLLAGSLNINGVTFIGNTAVAQVGTAQVGTAQVGEPGDEDYAEASSDYVAASSDYAAAIPAVTSATVKETTFAQGVIENDTSIALNSTTNEFLNGNPFAFGVFAPINASATSLAELVYNDQTVANGVNPVPFNAGASSTPDAGNLTNTVPVAGAFFEEAAYRGAFAPVSTAPLFTTGWTALNVRGILVDTASGSLQ